MRVKRACQVKRKKVPYKVVVRDLSRLYQSVGDFLSDFENIPENNVTDIGRMIDVLKKAHSKIDKDKIAKVLK